MHSTPIAGTASLPSVAGRTPKDNDQALEQLLVHLHVPVLRYFRAWLSGSGEEDVLARKLVEETLLRVAQAPLSTGCSYTDWTTHAIATAHRVAHEVIGTRS
jgi:DNA-directed RNA polymerase specialized sigma24 family protein